MSRWLSPEKAARRAERAAQSAAQNRKEKRRTWLLAVVAAVIYLGVVVADYFWLRHRAKQRHEQHFHGSKTNAPVSLLPLDGQSQPTNHE